ncbi:unnamed protein product [Closterium sp. NIES-53]
MALPIVLTDPSFESVAASALVAELVDFVAACRLDYAASVVADSESDCPPSVGVECALGTDVLEDTQEDFECFAAAVPHLVSTLIALEGDPNAPDIPTPRSYAEAITGPYSSEWQIAMDAEMASWKSSGTYVDVVPPPGANIVDGMWIFKVKRASRSPPAFKARYRDYELHSLDFSTAFLQGSLHEEIWLRRPPGYTGMTFAALGFAPSTADPSLFLRTDTSLPLFYVLCTRDTPALTWVLQRFGFRYSSPQSTPLPTGYSLSAPPSDESVEPSGPYPELVGCLIYLMTCTRPDLAYPLSILARYVAHGRHRPEHLEAAKRVLRYLCSTSSIGARARRTGSSCEAEIYAGVMAAQELRWLTYLLSDLGERPRSSPVLYVDNKAMLALCQEHRLEHRTKHITLCYFLARELQQRGHLCLAYVATRTNIADIFTKALQPGDHQRPRPLGPFSPGPRAASPTVSSLLATADTDPCFDSAAASALVAELLDFVVACRLDYATALVAECVSASPPSVGGECALGTDVLEDRQEDFECLAAAVPCFASMLLAPEGDPDAPDIPTPRSYAEVPSPGANIVNGMWIFRVKRSPGSPSAFKARYVARGFIQQQGVDYFHTFSPTLKMTTLRVLLHVAAQRDYELHSLDFSTAFLQGSLHEEIWLRRPPGFTGSFPAGTQWSLRRLVHGLRQAPRKWHDTLRNTLAALGFAPSTADPSLFERTGTSLPSFCVLVNVDDLVFATADTETLTLVKSELQKRHTCTDLGELRSYLGLQITWDRARCTITLTRSHMVHQVLQRFGFQFSSPQPTPLSTGHSLSAPPSDKSIEPSGPYPKLVGCLITSGMGLVLGGRDLVVLIGHADASWIDDSATMRSSQGYTFSLGPWLHRSYAGSPTCLLPWESSLVLLQFSTVVTDPSFESAAVSALVAELLHFGDVCRLDYATSLVAESESDCPPSIAGESALGMDVLEDKQEEFECFASAVPHLVAMLLAHEGDPDAPDIPTQRSYTEAISGPYSSQWQTTMDAEMASWKSTGTYVNAVPPSGANIVDGMRIFRGVDFFQTFSPTPKKTTVRVLLHVAAQRDYKLHSLDFSTPFLQGSLHEEIWLRHPPCFIGSFPVGTQWSLRRPVYYLRQAPHEWHDTLRTSLAALGFAPSTVDTSLFLRTDTSLLPFYVLVYVDDLVFATVDIEALALVKLELQKRHTCIDLGELRSYLGLQITRDRARRTITLTQSHMVHQVFQRFGFRYSSPHSTPLRTSHSLLAPPSDESVEPSGPYLELVGCLRYLMTCTRPDITYPLSILVRYVAPGRHRPEHWEAAKRVLRYLCSTSRVGLVLGGRGSVVLTGHADVSWVDDLAMQHSSEGYTFSLGSGSVSWRSTRSSSVLSSSCEAEIYARAMAAQELRWLTYLLTDLGERPRSPPVLYVDNKAMIALCLEHRLEHRTKHIALRYFLARELQ